jgi:SOS-response transcriptional repressor LexA
MNTMDSTPSERLRQLLRAAGYDTAKEVAEAVGVAKSTVNAHQDGTRGIRPGMAKRYARLLGVPPEYILYGKNLNQAGEIEQIISTRDVALRVVPLLDCRALEQFRSILSGAKPMSDRQIFAPFELPPGNRIYAIPQQDNSMMEDGAERSIRKGDHVFVNPDLPHKSGSIVAALIPGEERAAIRKYRTVEIGPDGQTVFELVALNRDHGVIKDAQKLGIQILGVVIGLSRMFEIEAA